MYQAELRGKLSRKNENAEDILTSNVFSFFMYAPRELFLSRLLALFGLDVSEEGVLATGFHFWPVFEDRTEPDVVMVVGDYYVLIEAKYFSGFGQDQLRREVEGGEREAGNLGKEFRLVVLTAHYSYPAADLAVLPASILPRCKWVNWQAVTLLLYNILEEVKDLDEGWRLLASDLYTLLERKNLRSYAGPAAIAVEGDFVGHLGDPMFFDAAKSGFAAHFTGFTGGALPDTHLAPGDGPLFYYQKKPE
jgi:hypothetical protein